MKSVARRAALRAHTVRVRRLATVAAATAGLAASALIAAPPALAAVSPVVDRPANGVTAVGLPTVQIDGVVWSQAIVGNTVYAGGNFANARPAGAAPGTQLTPRANLLAYNLTTGRLITSFAPSLNAQVKAVAASPDGTRLYVGGSFTTANGQPRYRLAAYDTATGALDPTFHPTLDATVNALTVTSSTVYAGGLLSSANGVGRSGLAAFSTSGALLNWAPAADAPIDALQITPDGTHVIVGGSFTNLAGKPAYGLGSVDAITGASVPFAANQVIRDYSPSSSAAILSLATDGTAIYGTGFSYGAGNFEGAFSANPSTGALNWMEDCHGDTYSVYPSPTLAFTVSHAHYCANVGGFGELGQPDARRTLAFTKNATGTLLTNGEGGYANFAGQPSPSLVNWFPDLTSGSFTGQEQAAWTVTGNASYVVEGGEFPTVNGKAQQGLVRFAVPTISPDTDGPVDTSTANIPTFTKASATSATASWLTNWDRDDMTLTYRLYRNGVVIDTVSATSTFWNRPTLTYTVTGLTPGATDWYRVDATDPAGNTTRGGSASYTP